jgi:hypothetical protein
MQLQDRSDILLRKGTDYALEDGGSITDRNSTFSLLPTGYLANVSQGVVRLEHVADRSPPYNTKV